MGNSSECTVTKEEYEIICFYRSLSKEKQQIFLLLIKELQQFINTKMYET